jgi:prepilin-type N-terminal cleavage/methylation domain-containing protein
MDLGKLLPNVIYLRMPLRYRTRAYTLLELAVVMVLSGILFAMAYQALHFIQSSYSNFSQRNSQVVKNKGLFHWLNRDVRRADAVYVSDAEIICYRQLNTVVYKTGTNYIVRQQAGRDDTFKLKNIVATFYFENKIIEPKTPVLADHLQIEGQLENENVILGVFKSYAADELFRQKLTVVPNH